MRCILNHCRSLRRRPGNTLIEAAIVLPLVIFLVVFPAMEFGYMFYIKHTLQGAAREGARAAITPSAANSDVTSAVSGAMNAAGLGASGYTVAIRDVNDTQNLNVGGVSAGTGVLVKVTCTWGQVGPPQLGLFSIDRGKLIIGKTVMRKEG